MKITRRVMTMTRMFQRCRVGLVGARWLSSAFIVGEVVDQVVGSVRDESAACMM